VVKGLPSSGEDAEPETRRARPSTPNRYRIEALAKGLDVLRLFDDTTPPLTLRDVAERTGMPLPTAFRVVATLEEKGFLERLPDGVIRPGLALVSLGSVALRHSGIVQLSEHSLRLLAASTGETVNLGVLVGAQALYLARYENAGMVRANIQVGTTLPAAYTSIGKLLLAYLAPAERRRALSAHVYSANVGPNAVTTEAELEDRLAIIRTDGFAIQDEELAHGMRSIAVPIFGREAMPIAAINVAAGTTRQTVETLCGPTLDALQRTAADISKRMTAL